MKLIFRWYKNDPLEMNLTMQQCARLWQRYGDDIVRAFEEEAGLKFQQKEIRVRGSSHGSDSGEYRKPMRISTTRKDDEILLCLLTHELAHRLLSGNGFRRMYQKESTELLKGHKKIYLFLYDVWVRAFGKEMAEHLAYYETSKSESRAQLNLAWDWAMSHPYKERKALLAKLPKNNSSNPKAASVK